MTLRLALPLLVSLVLAACASRPVQQGPLPSAPPPVAPAKAPPLAAEQKFLNEWFSGTPVQIGAQDDGALRVAVPLRNSFDPGQAKVKPALGAVLDKVSTSLKRQPGAKIEVAAPADASSGTLAPERSDSVRDYLVAKGVRASRISRGASARSLVELRLLPPVAAIERLEDGALSGSGTRAPATPPARK